MLDHHNFLDRKTKSTEKLDNLRKISIKAMTMETLIKYHPRSGQPFYKGQFMTKTTP